MKLIVDLGNPGRSYARHRHNVGFKVIDELARRYDISVRKRAFDAVTGKGMLVGADALLVKPQTYMNRSGYSVGPLFGYFKCDVDDLIVIHDDIDLDLGRIKIVRGAGHGGHNGVRSIIEELGFAHFVRVRMGVGRPPAQVDPADYVLHPFAEDEREQAEELIVRAADVVQDLLELPFAEVQQKHH